MMFAVWGQDRVEQGWQLACGSQPSREQAEGIAARMARDPKAWRYTLVTRFFPHYGLTAQRPAGFTEHQFSGPCERPLVR